MQGYVYGHILILTNAVPAQQPAIGVLAVLPSPCAGEAPISGLNQNT